jgi:hypothetical protein
MEQVVKVGERREFYSTLQGADAAGIKVRNYTGQTVEVVKDISDTVEPVEPGGYTEPLFVVRAPDGVEFDAWQEELNGSVKKGGAFYGQEA